MSCYLTYDLGTTALKTALVSGAGSLLGVCTSEYTPRMPAPGQVEMDPDTYWQAVVAGTRQVLALASLDGSSVTAISFSAQGQTFVALDAFGQPLCPFLVWLDSRARAIASQWQERWLSVEHFRRVSGYPSISPELSVFKMAWLREQVPATRRTWKYLWLPDYLIFRLTGETVTDAVTARMGGLFSLETGQWDPALLDAAGVRPEQLPDVLPPGTLVGHLRPAPAAELGLPVGLPVCTGTNDQLAGAIGAGNLQPGLVTETTGTALAAITSLAAPLEDARIVLGGHAVAGLYYAMTYANTSAVLLTWLRDVCDQSGTDYPAFLAGTEAIPPGCDGLSVLPHFMGDNPPGGNPQARGAFLGLTLGHTRAHLARAIMEAVACLLRERLEPFTERQVQISRVRALGGGARNDLWLQIKADLLNLPVERPACTENANLGAAMLAALAVGQFARLEDAASAWYRTEAVFSPDSARAAIYQEVYRKYRYYSRLLYGLDQPIIDEKR